MSLRGDLRLILVCLYIGRGSGSCRKDKVDWHSEVGFSGLVMRRH